MDLLTAIQNSEVVGQLCAHIEKQQRVVATGSQGSSTNLITAAVAARTNRPVFLLTAHLDDADECEAELTGLGRPILRMPALEVLPGESNLAFDLFAQRLAVVRALSELEGTGADDASPVIVCPIQSVMQGVPAPERLGELVRTIAVGGRADPSGLAARRGDAGYKRLDAVEEPGDFALRGGILDIFPSGGTVVAGGQGGKQTEPIGAPIRIDFFGDEVESIREIDLETMGSDRALESVDVITNSTEQARPTAASVHLLELLPALTIGLISETLEVTEQGRG